MMCEIAFISLGPILSRPADFEIFLDFELFLLFHIHLLIHNTYCLFVVYNIV